MPLTAEQARAFYDRFGPRQDQQGYYEDPALDVLVAHSRLEKAGAVLEFGCGTGKLANRMLADHLPATCTYVGCDLSPVMVRLATERLSRYGRRAEVIQSDGSIAFPVCDQSVDRVVSTYVLDLLSEADIACFVAEAYRVLRPAGRLCLASLTHGVGLSSRCVSALWALVHRVRPTLVGGCRPIRLERTLASAAWRIDFREVIVSWGIPSEVVIAVRQDAGGQRGDPRP